MQTLSCFEKFSLKLCQGYSSLITILQGVLLQGGTRVAALFTLNMEPGFGDIYRLFTRQAKNCTGPLKGGVVPIMFGIQGYFFTKVMGTECKNLFKKPRGQDTVTSTKWVPGNP